MILDRKLKPWLVEVNISPRYKAVNTPDMNLSSLEIAGFFVIREINCILALGHYC